MDDKKFRIISHRGNLDGPDSSLENRLEHIEAVLKTTSFDVEIDLRAIDDVFFLGHDDPLNSVSLNFLMEHRCRLWIHCKDLNSYGILSRYRNYGSFTFNFFFHEKDPYVLTSLGWLWGFPKVEVLLTETNKRYVHVFNDDNHSYDKESMRMHKNICTDYPLYYESPTNSIRAQ